ncbi:hypothetical protein IFO70_32750 [Phormidium tenue FACHB-886]|nr:hypothetical protein [Phormidium tenue FACHB-886]
MNFFDQPQRRDIDSDRIAQQYQFKLPHYLCWAIGGFTGARLLGYVSIIFPQFLPLLWFPAAISAVIATVTGIRIKDNIKRGEQAIGNMESNALMLAVLLCLLPIVSYQLENRPQLQTSSHEQATITAVRP